MRTKAVAAMEVGAARGGERPAWEGQQLRGGHRNPSLSSHP